MKKPISDVKLLDCMEGMKQYPDKFFELAIVDPEYGLGEDGRKTKGREGYVRQSNGTKIFLPAKPYKLAGWDNKPPEQEYFDELFRVSKNQIIWGENYMTFNQKKLSSGRIIWDKVNGDNDFSDCEIAWTNLFNSTRQIEYMWAGFSQGKSLKDGRIQQGNKSLNEERIHPTHKPVLLYKWLLQYAKEGDKILDTHLGSGSSRIAAYLMGFDFYGFEIDEDYFQAQEKRFKEQTMQGNLFDYK